MRFTSIATFAALYLAGLTQSAPVESRGISSLYGVSYTARNSDGSCQSSSQITASVKMMKSSGISHIRTYSQECDQLPNILKAIDSAGGGMTVLAAVWIDGTANDDKEIQALKSTLSSSKTDAIRGILVGNEVIFKGIMSSSALVKKIKEVKSFAKGIDVGSAEIDGTYTPDMVAASDIVCANIQPFYSTVDIDGAFDNVKQRYHNFQKVAGGKEVMVTETGWPSSGASRGPAVPSTANALKFAEQISSSSFPYYYFEWEDATWKGSTVDAHFGLLGGNGKSKFAL
ncbi:glycoside hydrolase superfamily [Choanephora cucurbitarum]|nr:glycoside hydrolase superfamily [Choanephora cucurbitarum]